MKNLLKHAITALALLLTPLLFGQTINEAAGTVRMFAAIPNGAQLTVLGTNFSPTGAKPTIALAGSQLTVNSFTNQSVLAALPASVPTGTYLLVLTNSNGASASLSVGLGAAPAILSGYCGISATQHVGVLEGLGASGTPQCFNGRSVQSNDGTGLPMPSGGILRHLTVIATPDPNANGSYPVSIQVYINNVVTALNCTLTISATSNAACSDNTDAVPVNAGDVLIVQMNGNPTGLAGDDYFSLHAAIEKQ